MPNSPHAASASELDRKALDAVLQSKSRKPDFPLLGISRVTLLHQAVQASHIVWLQAPAGYGKTIAMADYFRFLQQEYLAAIWITLDLNDQYDFILLRTILEISERQLPGISKEALEHWYETEKRGQVDTEQVLILWLQGLLTTQEPIYLFLDDVHELGNGSGWQLLVRLLEQMPTNIKIILAARALPSSLGRIRLMPRLTWLELSDLQFNDDETQQFLINSSIENAAILAQGLSRYLQGWPAGLAIWVACFKALGQSDRVIEYVAKAELSDYLRGEALHNVTPDLQEFVREVSALGTFNEEMLLQFYGNNEYHDLLQKALQQNLFLIPKENEHGWYSVHPVMAQFLASQLPLTKRQGLHRFSFKWLSIRDQPVAALRHALAAGMIEEVQDWVVNESESILANLDIAGLLDWFEQLGEDLLRVSPRLMAIACWAYLLTQQREKAQLLLSELLHIGCLQNFERDAFQGYVARINGQFSESEELCQRALNNAPENRFTLRMLMANTLVHLRLANQDAEGARVWNRLSQDLARQHHIVTMEALSLFDHARIELNRGHIAHSSSIIDQGLQLLDTGKNDAQRLPRGRLLLYRAVLLWLQGDPKKQLSEVLYEGIDVSTQLRDVCVCYGYAVRAACLASVQQYAKALDELDAAERLMQRWQVSLETYQWLTLVRMNVWLSEGKFSRAQKALDELLKGKHYTELPRPEVFPMLPMLAQLTQVRLWLLLGENERCLQFIERSLRQSGSVVNQAILGLMRAAAMRETRYNDSQQILAVALKALQREGISIDLLNWLPGLREPIVMSGEIEELEQANHLSERELDVLKKIAQGLSNQEIADQLFISLHTVKTHARKINVKLGVKSRTQALHHARELKLI